MAALETRLRAIELDWEEVYEKIRRTLQRITKRAEYIEKHETPAESPPELTPPGMNGSSVSPATGRLSDRQRAIQQQILKRRGGG
jgi:hypothetical protein